MRRGAAAGGRYRLNASTIAMPCNDSGFMPPAMFKHWGVLSWDWSNAKVPCPIRSPRGFPEPRIPPVLGHI